MGAFETGAYLPATRQIAFAKRYVGYNVALCRIYRKYRQSSVPCVRRFLEETYLSTIFDIMEKCGISYEKIIKDEDEFVFD